jgi:hypothetical protein
MRDYSLSRLQARTLRRLAEAHLEALKKKLATQSPATPAPPLPGRERPWVETRLAIERMEGAIRKLKSIETT